MTTVDFSNTQNAFEAKSDAELRRMYWLFSLMNKAWLVNVGSKLGLAALRLRLPLVKPAMKATIFEQFCGGTTLLDCQDNIDRLYRYDTLTILDYGAEAKNSEQDFNKTMNETIRAIDFAATNESVPVVSTKVTGMARFSLLEKLQTAAPDDLTGTERTEYRNVVKRLESICHRAQETGVGVFFDAEESWIQNPIDDLVMQMMQQFNTTKAVAYNTYQLYRHDRLEALKKDHRRALDEGFMLGAKLVRGAYMDKERERALAHGYPSPIQPDKASTDRDFNDAVRYCLDHYDTIASCNASHNQQSCELQIELMDEYDVPRNHPHVNFCQLYGMSDHLTFNLAQAGYNVAKYLPYGSLEDVVPYLIRRAQENSSVTGDMSRELSLITKEMKRRGLLD